MDKIQALEEAVTILRAELARLKVKEPMSVEEFHNSRDTLWARYKGYIRELEMNFVLDKYPYRVGDEVELVGIGVDTMVIESIEVPSGRTIPYGVYCGVNREGVTKKYTPDKIRGITDRVEPKREPKYKIGDSVYYDGDDIKIECITQVTIPNDIKISYSGTNQNGCWVQVNEKDL